MCMLFLPSDQARTSLAAVERRDGPEHRLESLVVGSPYGLIVTANVGRSADILSDVVTSEGARKVAWCDRHVSKCDVVFF